MPFRTQALKMILTVLLLVAVPVANAQAPRKAPAFDWLFISNYLRFDQQDLTVLFQNNPGCRAWNMSPLAVQGKTSSRMVSWTLPDHGVIKFLLVNGKTELVVRIVDRGVFRDIEEQLNRRLSPVNDHVWIDTAGREWSLEPVPGTAMCALRVNLPTR